ncbi:MAG: benzoyl-CoA-dihydrodiol lyase [Deltaproteobacteria bacterium]|nr:benzoyl-CoA-dihydrodiol lyase [Deltaproteobacteria bacterium]
MGDQNFSQNLSFESSPAQYKHWQLSFDGDVATLGMDVTEDAVLGDYTLKLNSYDLAVDIELNDAINRIRFEHPEVKSVIVTGAKDKVFCSGANIYHLGQSSHAYKVNFCKYTNETRMGIEDASENSSIQFLAALNGTASGGGYEMALACDDILLIDDRNSAVSFPEVPLLAVLPGTGGLTRITDKRKVRRDLCDVFSTVAEGVKGKRAKQWGLVDEIAPKSKWDEAVQERAKMLAARSDRPGGEGIKLNSIAPKKDGTAYDYKYVSLVVDEKARTSEITLKAPSDAQPYTAENLMKRGDDLWMLRAYRELDDALLRLRMHYLDVTMLTLKTEGRADLLLEAEGTLLELGTGENANWFAREVLHHMKRVLKRLDVTSKTMVALVEPGSCWAGSFCEVLWAADRSFMLDDVDAETAAVIQPTMVSGGALPMAHGLSRLENRFYGAPDNVKAILSKASEGQALICEEADELGVVTFVRDDIDYPDELRLFVEERTSLSSDALTGMEQNLRWVGPETMETRIFGRLTAWQNWIFTRPNATGEEGALTVYGSPNNAVFNTARC